MAEKKPRTMDAVIGEFLADVEKLPPEERADLHQAFFDKYLKPRWGEMSPQMRQVLPQLFMGSTQFPEGDLQTWQPKGFHERTLESAGGGFRDPTKGNPLEMAGSAMHDVFLPFRYPLRAAGEAIDTAQYGTGQRPQPKAIGPGSVIPQTTGSLGAEAADWTLLPKVISAMLRIPGMAGRVLGRLNEFGSQVRSNYAQAAAENMMSRLPQQRALPPRGGTYGAQGPFPMPPSSLPPQPPMHAPRPPSLMPQPRAGGDIGPKLIRGPKGEVYLDPEG